MTISLTHAKVSVIADDAAAALAGEVVPSDWNDEHVLELAQNRVLGRTSSGTGAAEELPFGTVASSLVQESVAALRLLTTATYGGGNIYLRGHYAPGDYADGITKGSGWYYYDSTEAGADNGSTIIVDASSRRWVLQHNGTISNGQAGCYVDGATDDLAAWDDLLTLLNTNTSGINRVILDAGSMMLSDNPTAITGDNITFSGLNLDASQMRFLSTATDKGCFFTLGASGNPANFINIERIGFINDDNELTLTGADAPINAVRTNDLTIENCYFSSCCRWMILGADAEATHARKTNISFCTYEPSPKPDCDVVYLIHATGTRFVGNRMSQAVKRYALHYDAQTANFAVAETVTGGTSGATGVIVKVLDSGASGTLWINTLTGVFADNEIITTATGSATANIAAGLKTLAYDNRLILIKPGTDSTGVDSFHFSTNEMNWNAMDVEYLIEIDPTLKGVSNCYFASANVIDGGSIATFYVHIDSSANAMNDRLHNLIIEGNRIASNGSGIGPVGVTMKVVLDYDNLISGVTVTGNNLLGAGVLHASSASGADGYFSATFSGNSIVRVADPTVALHTDGGVCFYTDMGGLTIVGNNVSYQDEANTYRYATFLQTSGIDPIEIVCTGNLIDQVSGATGFDLSSLTSAAGVLKTIVKDNAGKPNPPIRYEQTTTSATSNLAVETLDDGYTYRFVGRVNAVSAAAPYERAIFTFDTIVECGATGAATAVIVGSTATPTVVHRDDASWTLTIDANSNTIRWRVSDADADDINWSFFLDAVEIFA